MGLVGKAPPRGVDGDPMVGFFKRLSAMPNDFIPVAGGIVNKEQLLFTDDRNRFPFPEKGSKTFGEKLWNRNLWRKINKSSGTSFSCPLGLSDFGCA